MFPLGISERVARASETVNNVRDDDVGSIDHVLISLGDGIPSRHIFKRRIKDSIRSIKPTYKFMNDDDIVEFFNAHHPDLHDPETGEENNYEGEDFDGMFRFEKRMK